jgi:hypothetical protein
MMGVTSFDGLIKEGKATFVGDRKAFDQVRALMVPFAPNFEILPGTAPQSTVKNLQPMELPDLTPADSD